MSQPEIFYVLNSRWPTIKAYGLQVAKTCQGLKQAGAKVRLIVPIRARHREIAGIHPFTLYGVRDRFRLIRLPSLDFTRIHLNSRPLFFLQQIIFAAMAALALSFKRGAIYSRDQFTLYLLSFVRQHLYWEVHRFPEDMSGSLYRRLLSSLDGVVTITEGIRKEFIKLGYPASRIIIAPDGIDLFEMDIAPNRNEARQQLGLEPDKHVVMYTGQLLEYKGVDTLVQAAQLLDSRFRVIVIGGTERDITRLRSIDTGGKVEWRGHIPHNKIPLWLRCADTVVLPNKKDGAISEFYTSPLKMFEYMASGKPIVASNLPSLREVLNERNAILITPDDAPALASGILRAATETEHAAAVAAQARRDVGQYTWERRGKTILDFIAQRL